MRNAEWQWKVDRRATLALTFRIRHSALGAPTDLIQLFEPHQHVPRLRPIRRSQYPCQLQLVDYPRRPAVPDAHAPLQQRCGAELVLDADLRGLAEQGIALARGALLPLAAAVLPGFLRFLQRRHLFIDARASDRRLCGMRLVPVHQPLGLVGRDERSLHPEELALAGRQKQHVPVPEHGLGAVLIENRAAVDLGRDSKRDATREVCLDEAGDDVHRRTLGGEHQVNADGARLLRERGEGRFDLALYGEHQICQLVDDQHDIGEDAAAVFAVEWQLLLNAGLRRQRLARTLEWSLLLDLAVEVHDVAGVVGMQQPVA